MTHIAGVIYPFGYSIKNVHVFGISLPAPLNPGEHRISRNILCSLQITKNQIRFCFTARRQSKTTISHNNTGHAVIAGT